MLTPSLFVMTATLLLSSQHVIGNQDSAPPNHLFFVSDDLRPEMGLYGGKAITPHLDAFAKLPGTVIFDRAYVQQAICCPTRSSFLTGRRPDTTKVWDLKTQFRDALPNVITLPGYFREKGYWTAGMGKVFHPVQYKGKTDDVAGGSWSAPYFHASGLGGNMSMCWNENMGAESQFQDMLLAAHAVTTLQQAAENVSNAPFFVAVGFHRPHLPWDVPSKYFDLYPEEDIQLADYNQMPIGYNDTGAELWSWDPQSGPRHCGPLKQMGTNLPRFATVPDTIAKKFRRGYYAAVSQTDDNFGTVMNELNRLNLQDSTIVTFIGDHGWQLGDLGEFGKKTNFERATRTPLIIRDPRRLAAATRSSALIEFVDIMPTLVELSGYSPLPQCPDVSTNVRVCTEGHSLLKIIHNPGNATNDWSQVSFMQYAHCMHDDGIWDFACRNVTEPHVMGYAIRTRRWRYIEWVGFDKFTTPPTIKWDQVHGTELYDHTISDTVENIAESRNVVTDPSLQAEVQQLHTMLKNGWKAYQPTDLS